METYRIFDSHAHYDDEAFDEDRDELLASLPAHGIGAVVNVGASLASTKNTLELTRRWPFVWGAAGVHPSETAQMREADMEWLKQICGEEKIAAVGEIGLDYHWPEPDREIQKRWFVRQLQLAGETGLPVIIHSRDAAQDTLDILKAHRRELTGGVIHCFSYGVEMAREYLDMGFYLGVGGVVTFSNARKLKEVTAYAPMDRILLETDCPYLAPVPNRGKRNSSLYLPAAAEAIAAIKGISAEDVIRITWDNAVRMYGLTVPAL